MTFFQSIQSFGSFLANSSEASREGVRVVPAVGASVLTLDSAVTVLTFIYIAIQAAYLLRKWWREEMQDKEAT